jgi:hypothetical protein
MLWLSDQVDEHFSSGGGKGAGRARSLQENNIFPNFFFVNIYNFNKNN